MSVAAVLAFEAHDDAYDFPYIPIITQPLSIMNCPAIRGSSANRIDKGEVRLAYDPQHGVIFRTVESPASEMDSQMLVFLKPLSGSENISPPRALYFNDNVALGLYTVATSWKLRPSIRSRASFSIPWML
jgi:hypothetical protein